MFVRAQEETMDEFKEAGMRLGTMVCLVLLFLFVLALVLSSFENDNLAREACRRRGGDVIEHGREAWTCLEQAR